MPAVVLDGVLAIVWAPLPRHLLPGLSLSASLYTYCARVLASSLTIPGTPFSSFRQDNYEIYELVPVLLLGVIGGLLGSSFIAINAKLSEWRRDNVSKHGTRAKIIEALAISILTSTVSFMLPLMFGCQVSIVRVHT